MRRGHFLTWARAGVAALLSWALAAPALAAGGGKGASKLVNVADTRGLEPGLSRWIAGVYNESFWLFGLLTVAVMVGMGLILGLATDKAVGLLGINLGKISHHE
ncbi:MAG: hypothetical protein HRF46_06975 [Acidobacteriota bacterium]